MTASYSELKDLQKQIDNHADTIMKSIESINVLEDNLNYMENVLKQLTENELPRIKKQKVGEVPPSTIVLYLALIFTVLISGLALGYIDGYHDAEEKFYHAPMQSIVDNLERLD